jgi:uncharacterized protein YprB with RNaseH-like and TPR domain/predicted nuclease with RNAse H fold
MLKNTFSFIPGVGEQTERQLWRNGVVTWDDLQQHPNEISHDRVSTSAIQKYLSDAKTALEQKDAIFFTEKLPQNKYWRLFEAFRDQILYLDIETTGLSWYYDRITTVATYDGETADLFVKDHNLDELPDLLKENKILVTFNGKRFDQVFLEEHFHDLRIPPIHLDLMYLSRSVGMEGSLKEIESELNIHRPPQVDDFRGEKAPVLWRQFLRGDTDAFRRLAIYNIYDSVNLAELFHEVYRRKVNEVQTDISTEYFQTTLDEIDKEVSRSLKNNIFTGKVLQADPPTLNFKQDPEGLAVHINNSHVLTVDYNRIEQPDQDIQELISKINTQGRRPHSVGIDLAGSKDNPTGFCSLDGANATLQTAWTDEEILNAVLDYDPDIVSIDSPLTLPEGRCCVEESCECSEHGIMRECERLLKERGVNVYPCLIDSMRNLTARGHRLSRTLSDHGYETIESYPGAAQDVLNIPRKQISLEELEVGLRDTGIDIQGSDRKISNDELDALTSALVGHFYLAGQYEHVGRSKESGIVIPSLSSETNRSAIETEL